jgi:hypothetical protein
VEQTGQVPVGAPAAAGADQYIDTLLQEITSELNRFEAKKLTELKTELENFIKRRDALFIDYDKKYSVLKERWLDQHQQIKKIYTTIKCTFQDDGWKKIIEDCICKYNYVIYCDKQRILNREACSHGQRERARNVARQHFDSAKAYLDALAANAQRIEADLNANDKLIKDIQALVPGPDQALSLYLFWFELLPTHKRLMPDDVAQDIVNFAATETPKDLCSAVYDKPCEPEKGACTPVVEPDSTKQDAAGTEQKERRPVPWLISPGKYSEALSDAWQDYRNAKDVFADKEAEYKTNPDDLASLNKVLEENKKSVKDRIKTCLKSAKPDEKTPGCNGDRTQGTAETKTQIQG